MNPIFIDTGLLIALEISDDQHHKVAIKYWKELLNRPPQLVTTSYIFDEVVTFFNTRNYHLKAVELGNNLINSSFIQLIPVNEDLFNEGWLYFQKHQDKTYSLTDCLSFVIMQQLKINTALTFDRHFIQAGFKILPSIN